MTFPRAVLAAAAVALCAPGCAKDKRRDAIPFREIVVLPNPHLRASAVGGYMDPGELEVRKRLGQIGDQIYPGESAAVVAAYVLVDAENQSLHDAYVTLDGTLNGDGKTAALKAESLFVPAGAKRTFLLLDDELKERPWAQGVEVEVTGAKIAGYPPAVAISDVNVFDDGDHVVAAATATLTVAREAKAIVHCAFHDQAGNPIGRGHTVLGIKPGERPTVRFVGPRGSATATIFPGDAAF